MRQIEVSREFLEEFEKLKKDFNSLYFALRKAHLREREFSEINAKLFCNVGRDNEHQLEFAEVWAGKAEYVVKEQLYYVRLIDVAKGYLAMNVETRNLFLHTKEKIDGCYKTIFTEQEIKDIDERYWSFAIPVEELGGKK